MAITIIDKPYEVSLTGNRMPVALTTDIASTYGIVEIFLAVKWLNGANWETIKILKKQAVENMATFNIATYLDKKSTCDFTFPESADNLMIQHSNMTVKYKLSYYESFIATEGGIAELSAEVELNESFYALQGGIPDELEALYNTAQTDFYNELCLDKRMLTWLPKVISVAPDQPVKLYHLVRTSGTHYLKMKKDGGSAVTLKYLYCTAFNQIELCVGPDLLDLDDTVNEYTIYIQDSSGETYEERTFIIDRDYFERNDFLLLQNSLGAFDPIWAQGRRSTKIKLTREKYSKKLPAYADNKTRNIYSDRATLTKKRKSYIGWVTDMEYNEYLEELFLTANLYWLDGTLCRPVNIVTTSFTEADDKNDGLEDPFFEWEPSFKNRYFAKHQFALRVPLPPYWEDVTAMFDRRIGNKLIDRKQGLQAEITATGVVFPTITGHDVWNKTLNEFWLADIPNTYGNDRGWLYAELTGLFTVDYSTIACSSKLFFKDIDGSVRTTLPIPIYNRILTAEEIIKVSTWLDEYVFLMDASGAIIVDGTNFVTKQF